MFLTVFWYISLIKYYQISIDFVSLSSQWIVRLTKRRMFIRKKKRWMLICILKTLYSKLNVLWISLNALINLYFVSHMLFTPRSDNSIRVPIFLSRVKEISHLCHKQFMKKYIYWFNFTTSILCVSCPQGNNKAINNFHESRPPRGHRLVTTFPFFALVFPDLIIVDIFFTHPLFLKWEIFHIFEQFNVNL